MRSVEAIDDRVEEDDTTRPLVSHVADFLVPNFRHSWPVTASPSS